MMSPSDEKRIVAMVDSFTKTVARNFSRNLKRAKANAEKHWYSTVDYVTVYEDKRLVFTFRDGRQVEVTAELWKAA